MEPTSWHRQNLLPILIRFFTFKKCSCHFFIAIFKFFVILAILITHQKNLLLAERLQKWRHTTLLLSILIFFCWPPDVWPLTPPCANRTAPSPRTRRGAACRAPSASRKPRPACRCLPSTFSSRTDSWRSGAAGPLPLWTSRRCRRTRPHRPLPLSLPHPIAPSHKPALHRPVARIDARLTGSKAHPVNPASPPPTLWLRPLCLSS